MTRALLPLLSVLALAVPGSAAAMVAPGRVAFPVAPGPSADTDRGGARLAVATPDGGAVLLGGTALVNHDRATRVAVARITRSGSLDASFGRRGVARIVLPIAGFAPRSIARETDGGVLVAGTGLAAADDRLPELVLVRLDRAGRLESGFGRAGVVDTGVESSCAYCAPAAIQPDGRIVVTGATGSAAPMDAPTGGYQWVAAGLLPDGARDPSFGQDGTVTVRVAPSDNTSGLHVALLPDGRIVLLGRGSQTDRLIVVRLTPAGAVDPGYQGGGPAFVPLPEDFAMLARGDGSVEVLGDHQLVRLDPSGELDRAFGAGGTIDFGWSSGFRRQLLAAPDGSTFVARGAGYEPRAAAGAGDLVVYRVTPAGQVDPAFGGLRGRTLSLGFGGGQASGFWRTQPRSITPLRQSAFRLGRLLRRPDGSWMAVGGVPIVQYAGGWSGTSVGLFAAASLTPDLHRDDAFGGRRPHARIRVSLPPQRGATVWRRRRLVVRLSASSAGLALVTVRAAHHGVVAHATAPIYRAGRTSAELTFTRSGRQLFRARRRVRLSLSVRFRDVMTGLAHASAHGRLR